MCPSILLTVAGSAPKMACACLSFFAMSASYVKSQVRLSCSISYSTYRPIKLLVHAPPTKAPLKVASQSGKEKKCERPRCSTHTMVPFESVTVGKAIDMVRLWISETRSFTVVNRMRFSRTAVMRCSHAIWPKTKTLAC